jgi:hypothetical protein
MLGVVLKGTQSGHGSGCCFVLIFKGAHQTLVFGEKHSNAGIDFADG